MSKLMEAFRDQMKKNKDKGNDEASGLFEWHKNICTVWRP